MAGLATAAISTLGELAMMRIRRMAIRAILESNRLSEIAGFVAFVASDLEMFPYQRVLRLRVIKSAADILHRDDFPPTGHVTGAARVFETSVVWIGVAHAATIKRQIRIARLAVRTIDVALRAGHFDVCARQRILGLRVVERGGCRPVLEVVTALAVRTQPALVFITVAGRALLRKPNERFAQVLFLDRAALGGRNVLRTVALLAVQSCVFALQDISCLTVIESFGSRRPAHEDKIFPVVIGVTFHAALAACGLAQVGGMQSSACRKSCRDITVALQALERGLSGRDSVTRRALSGAVQALVGARKWTGRDLCKRAWTHDHANYRGNQK